MDSKEIMNEISQIFTDVLDSDEDIVLQGRYNTDIIQKDRQIWIRTGKVSILFNNYSVSHSQTPVWAQTSSLGTRLEASGSKFYV